MKLKLARINQRVKFLFVLAAVVTLIGCDSELFVPATVPVSGTVMLDGNPLPGAHILLVPVDTKNGRGRSDHVSYAITGPSGEYSLKTGDGEDGAARGKHLVLISKQKPSAAPAERPAFDNPETPPVSQPESTMNQGDAIELLSQVTFPWMAAGRAEELEIVPVRYNRESTLSVTIEKSGTKKLDFELSGAENLP